jgi:hypothetical protein
MPGTQASNRLGSGARRAESGGQASPPVVYSPRPPSPWSSNLWSGFVDYVEGCFRRSAETVEAGRRNNLPNACLAGLGT